jgi:hypothetical protein
MTTEIVEQAYTKIPRAELVESLRTRDGDVCQYPDCGGPFDFDVIEGPMEVTIDHWIPQYVGRAEGWTMDQIWDLDNLKLMHKKCNAKKGDRIPNEDGTLPPKPQSTFRFRRQKRANRPDKPCEFCDNGHNLSIGEVCAQCGVNAQAFPRWAKMKANECDHAAFWCWACSIGVTPRVGATEMIVLGGEGGDE